jgi:hypothetical protein
MLATRTRSAATKKVNAPVFSAQARLVTDRRTSRRSCWWQVPGRRANVAGGALELCTSFPAVEKPNAGAGEARDAISRPSRYITPKRMGRLMGGLPRGEENPTISTAISRRSIRATPPPKPRPALAG